MTTTLTITATGAVRFEGDDYLALEGLEDSILVLRNRDTGALTARTWSPYYANGYWADRHHGTHELVASASIRGRSEGTLLVPVYSLKHLELIDPDGDDYENQRVLEAWAEDARDFEAEVAWQLAEEEAAEAEARATVRRCVTVLEQNLGADIDPGDFLFDANDVDTLRSVLVGALATLDAD